MKFASLFAVSLTLAALLASPAEARRIRIPIPFFSSGESIDLVYDLPNEQPFVRDGEFLDIGYLNSRKGNAYVLYHGDRYNKLSDGDIALFTGLLGFDPTAAHRAQHASGAESAPVKQADAIQPKSRTDSGNAIVRQPGESREDFAARTKAFVAAHRSPATQEPVRNRREESKSASVWFGFLPVIGYVAILFFLARTILRRMRRVVSAALPSADDFTDVANAAIDARAANRMTSSHPDTASTVYAPSRAERYVSTRAASGGAPVRTFGRRHA